MEVSRIGAISPTQVDWRKLTSKEIIEYENQGVEVPSQYLQWAQEFQRTLAAGDSDDTTYEAAIAPAPQASSNATPIDTETSGDDTSSTGEVSDNTPKTAAQAKREELENAGVSLSNQAKIFTNESKSATRAVLESIVQMTDAQEQSVSELQGLEDYMNSLLSNAESTQNDLKSEVSKINNGDSDISSFAKINKLQQQLERYGTEGQANIASSESDFSVYQATINGQTNSILNAQDFGAETIEIGNSLLATVHSFFNLRDIVIGRRAVKAGENAVSWSESASEVQTQASETNTDNISAAKSYENQVEARTGVGAAPKEQNADNSSNQNGENKNEADKSVQTAQNDGTKSSTLASASIDEILKAKIRKGEDINAQSA